MSTISGPPLPPPRADEVYQVEIEDVRKAQIWVSFAMILFGLFMCVSLLTGPIIAGTFGGVTMLICGLVSMKLTVGSVIMFKARPPPRPIARQLHLLVDDKIKHSTGDEIETPAPENV